MPDNTEDINALLTTGNAEATTVYFYGYIGNRDERMTEQRNISDIDVVEVFQNAEAAGVVRIDNRMNCVGGSMMQGTAIINTVKTSKMDVHMHVDGVAASMGAFIFLSVKKANRHMARNSKLMIHSGRGSGSGTADEIREAALALDSFNDSAIAQMAQDTGKSEDEIRAKYFDGKDHWLTANDALEAGFISQIEDYDAEGMPDNIEGMTEEEMYSHFNPTKNKASLLERGARLVEKVAAKLTPEPKPQPITPENSTDMTIEEFNAAVADGTISPEVIAATLTASGYTVEAPAPAPTPEQVNAEAITAAVTAAVTAATKPLLDNVTALEAKVAAFGKLPGADPAVATATVDPAAAPVQLTEAQAKLKAENERIAAEVNGGNARFTT